MLMMYKVERILRKVVAQFVETTTIMVSAKFKLHKSHSNYYTNKMNFNSMGEELTYAKTLVDEKGSDETLRMK